MEVKNRERTKNVAYIALMVAFMAICSFITVPGPVPFTLQTFGVFFALLMLGGKKGIISILVYIVLGAIGVPVFAGFSGGIGHITGLTGGYIVGFLLTGVLYLAMEKFANKKLIFMIITLALGLICCYAFGTFWFVAVYTKTTGSIGFASALLTCVVPFIIPDALKIALALLISNRIKKHTTVKD